MTMHASFDSSRGGIYESRCEKLHRRCRWAHQLAYFFAAGTSSFVDGIKVNGIFNVVYKVPISLMSDRRTLVRFLVSAKSLQHTTLDGEARAAPC